LQQARKRREEQEKREKRKEKRGGNQDRRTPLLTQAAMKFLLTITSTLVCTALGGKATATKSSFTKLWSDTLPVS
jgi:hypothetical protein